MFDYVKPGPLRHSGPTRLFPSPLFYSPMTLRSIHRTVIGDYTRAYGNFGRPHAILGKENNVSRLVEIGASDFIVEIVPTADEWLLHWDGDVCKPLWRVRIARDPDQKGRGLKDVGVYAPFYTLGKIGAHGALMALTPDKASLIREEAPAADGPAMG